MGRPTSRPSPVASLDNFYRGTLSGHGADGHGSRRNGGWSRALTSTRRRAGLDPSGRSWSQVIASDTRFRNRLGGGRGILPVASPRPTGWAYTGGQDPAELLASAEQLLRRICVMGAPPPLLGLRALVAQLIWEANTGAGA